MEVVDAHGAHLRQVGDLDAVVELAGLVLAECVVRVGHDTDFIKNALENRIFVGLRSDVRRGESVQRIVVVLRDIVVLRVEGSRAVLFVSLGHTQSDADIVGDESVLG